MNNFVFQGKVDQMVRMVAAISSKDDVKINSNTFELVLEVLLEKGEWKKSLSILSIMEKLRLKPSLQIYVNLVELLEKSRQYRAVLALYRIMTRDGYDFYENSVLNGMTYKSQLLISYFYLLFVGVFKRLVDVAAVGINADSAMIKMADDMKALIEESSFKQNSHLDDPVSS